MYISRRCLTGIIFVGIFRDEADIPLDLFPLLFHAANTIDAFLLLDALHDLLILLHDLDQLPLPEGLVQGSFHPCRSLYLFPGIAFLRL